MRKNFLGVIFLKEDYIGNERARQLIGVAIMSAKMRNSSPPHLLFAGAPGCGKTTLANMVAGFMESKFIQADPGAIKNYKDARTLLSQLSRDGYNIKGEKIGPTNPSVIFLDEIHNLPLRGQELLGLAMENFILPTPATSPIKRDEYPMWIPEFVLIGATTNDGKLSKPFRDRFELKFLFSVYTLKESEEIIKVHARKLGIGISEASIKMIALKGRGVPRILVNYLRSCRDMALSMNRKVIEKYIVEAAFNFRQINEEGLGLSDLALLKALFMADVPLGVQNLSIILNESAGTIEASIEPFLIQSGLMMRGPRGREITPTGIRYLSDKGYVSSDEAMRLLIERS